MPLKQFGSRELFAEHVVVARSRCTRPVRPAERDQTSTLRALWCALAQGGAGRRSAILILVSQQQHSTHDVYKLTRIYVHSNYTDRNPTSAVLVLCIGRILPVSLTFEQEIQSLHSTSITTGVQTGHFARAHSARGNHNTSYTASETVRGLSSSHHVTWQCGMPTPAPHCPPRA